jgi:hypothetical protein
MSTRNYNDALAGTNTEITISGGGLRQDFTNVFLDDEDYFAWDDGSGFYTTTADKDVHTEDDGEVTSWDGGGAALVAAFCLSDGLNGLVPILAGNVITNYLNVSAGASKFVVLREWVNGVLQGGGVVFGFNFLGTQYWRKFEIDWTAATFTVTYYTNSIRTITAFTPQVISLSKDRANQYIYGMNSNDAGAAGGSLTGFSQNFNQITPDVAAGQEVLVGGGFGDDETFMGGMRL